MALQTELQAQLETLLGSDNVYFQPPPNVQMVYPCIVYKISEIEITHADNIVYLIGTSYTVTSIDKNPNSLTPYQIAKLPYAKFSTRFVTEGLYHTIFSLYY